MLKPGVESCDLIVLVREPQISQRERGGRHIKQMDLLAWGTKV
jgi:hypothetical protein